MIVLLYAGVGVLSILLFFATFYLMFGSDDPDYNKYYFMWTLFTIATLTIPLVFISLTIAHIHTDTPYKFTKSCDKAGGQVVVNNKNYTYDGMKVHEHTTYSCVIDGKTIVTKELG